jgi:integrase/recombinase XerD
LPPKTAIEWDVVDRPTLQDFLVDLERQGYTDRSVARKAAAIRSFFAFLAREDSIQSNPADSLPSPRLRKIPPKVLSGDELNLLLEQPCSRNSPKAKRDRAMLQILSATGIRVSELVSLDVTNVDLQPEPIVRCPGNAARNRTIPIDREAAEALRQYLNEARPLLLRDRKDTALFLNQRGERLSRQGFWLIFKGYAREACLDNETTPRDLRHSCGARMLSEGIPVSTVQEMLGHAHAGTTRAYLARAGRRNPPGTLGN